MSVEFKSESSRWEQETIKLVKKFKVSDKLVCQARVEAYAEMGEWALLFRYSNEKKPPAGYKPFALACMK